VKSSAETHAGHHFSEDRTEGDSDSRYDYTSAVERRRRRRAERARQNLQGTSGIVDFM
jgi:hypothetical protein